MNLVTSTESATDSIVFGFGNFGGLGEALVAHWTEVGDPLTARPPDHPAALPA